MAAHSRPACTDDACRCVRVYVSRLAKPPSILNPLHCTRMFPPLFAGGYTRTCKVLSFPGKCAANAFCTSVQRTHDSSLVPYILLVLCLILLCLGMKSKHLLFTRIVLPCFPSLDSPVVITIMTFLSL